MDCVGQLYNFVTFGMNAGNHQRPLELHHGAEVWEYLL